MKCWIRAALWWGWAFADWDYRDAYWAHCDASDAFWAMTVPTTAAFVACSRCRRFLPVETLREYRGGNKRLMRYCPACWERRTKAIAALKRVPENKTRLAPGFRPCQRASH